MTRRMPTIIPQNTVGLVLAFEFVMDFLVWADGCDVTPAQIQKQWGVSRATSYRYHSALQRWKEMHPGRVFARKRPAS